LLKDASDTYIFHEHLEEVNRPVYFHEFAKRAAAHHLQYLAEAHSTLLTQSLSPEVTQTLERLAIDVIHGEQYLDFVRGRTFRRTLLCHQQVALKRPPSPENVALMQATGVAKPVTEQPNLAADVVEVFATPE